MPTNPDEINLEEVEELAGAGYTPKEVAYMLGLKPSAFLAEINKEDSDISIAYFKGFYSSELSVRQSILQLARNASSPAQTMAIKLFDETRKNLTKGGFPGFE